MSRVDEGRVETGLAERVRPGAAPGTPLRVAIVDDEPLARELVRTLVRKRSDVEIVGDYSSAADALEGLQREPADVLLLDVSMPEMDGFDLLERLGPDATPVVVFTTAYEQHALRAFDVSAADYLLKPIDQGGLGRALERARARLTSRALLQNVETLRQIVEDIRPQRRLERLPVRVGSRIILVPVEQLQWLEAEGNNVVLHTRSGGAHAIRDTLARLAEALDPERFVRISRSAIVNVTQIREVQSWFHGDYLVILDDGSRVQSTRSYRHHLEQVIGRGGARQE
jgi:two-component system LytT family response regulator